MNASMNEVGFVNHRRRRLLVLLAGCIAVGMIGAFPPRSRIVDGTVGHVAVDRGRLFNIRLPRGPMPKRPWGKGKPFPSERERGAMIEEYYRKIEDRRRTRYNLGRTAAGQACRIDVGRMLAELCVAISLTSTFCAVSWLREESKSSSDS